MTEQASQSSLQKSETDTLRADLFQALQTGYILDGQVTELRNEVTELTTQVNQLQFQIAQKGEQLNATEMEIQALKEENSTLREKAKQAATLEGLQRKWWDRSVLPRPTV